MESRTMSGIAAIGCLVAAAYGAPTASAQPGADGEKLCTITYPIPDGKFEVQGSTEVFAVSAGGVIDFKAFTNANSDQGYNQTFRVIWANLETGRNGGGEASAVVKGADNVLAIPAVETKPGRIALTLAIANNDGGQNYTNGDCTVEYTAK